MRPAFLALPLLLSYFAVACSDSGKAGFPALDAGLDGSTPPFDSGAEPDGQVDSGREQDASTDSEAGTDAGSDASSEAGTDAGATLSAGEQCSSNAECDSGACGTSGSGYCCENAGCITSGLCGASGCSETTGACIYPTETMPCGASCSERLLTLSACDGQGACIAGTPSACPGNLACASDSACHSSCEKDDDCAAASYFCAEGECKPRLANGQACQSNNQCGSEQCSDGVCCNTACDGACEACNVAGEEGVCSAIPSDTDPDNECDDEGAASCGLSGVCDGARACAQYAAGTVCRSSAGLCDPAELCPGDGAACPAEVFHTDTQVCRPSEGDCDVAEYCTGSSAECPSDGFEPSNSLCRAAAGDCDVAEYCTGSSAECPSDTKKSSDTVCRPYADICDKAEQCNGISPTCPADKVLGMGQQDYNDNACVYNPDKKYCDGGGKGAGHCLYGDGRLGAMCGNDTNCNRGLVCVNQRCAEAP